jgi:hypothetical protein
MGRGIRAEGGEEALQRLLKAAHGVDGELRRRLFNTIEQWREARQGEDRRRRGAMDERSGSPLFPGTPISSAERDQRRVLGRDRAPGAEGAAGQGFS